VKERCAERIQYVVRYKPSRDDNHHGSKRDASNLNNDRRVSRMAFRTSGVLQSKSCGGTVLNRQT
jgi:hypothetical protein